MELDQFSEFIYNDNQKIVLTFAQLVAFGIVLSCERRQDRSCLVQNKRKCTGNHFSVFQLMEYLFNIASVGGMALDQAEIRANYSIRIAWKLYTRLL